MTHLGISENDITTLGENVCGNMSLLEKLDASWNELTEILPSTFDQCTRLIELDVSWNGLTNIENVRFPVSMTHLDISDNDITT